MDFINSSRRAARADLSLRGARRRPHVPALYADRFGLDFARSGVPDAPSLNRGDQTKDLSGPAQLAPDVKRHALCRQPAKVPATKHEGCRGGVGEPAAALPDGKAGKHIRLLHLVTDGTFSWVSIVWSPKKNNAYEESIERTVHRARTRRLPSGTRGPIVANIDESLPQSSISQASPSRSPSMDARSFHTCAARWQPTGGADLLVLNYDGSWPNGDPVGILLADRDADWMFQHRATEQFDLYDMRRIRISSRTSTARRRPVAHSPVRGTHQELARLQRLFLPRLALASEGGLELVFFGATGPAGLRSWRWKYKQDPSRSRPDLVRQLEARLVELLR